MRILVVQPAGRNTLHCYISSGAVFHQNETARALSVDGVAGGHMVSAGRSPRRYCIIVHPTIAVEQGCAEALYEFVQRLARSLRCQRVDLLRPVERRDGGKATDIYDWLKV